MTTLKDKRGISLLITLTILGVLLAAALGVASVFTKEIQISGLVDDSVIAILAADAGLEKMLYNVRILDGDPEESFTGNLSNGASYTTCEDPTTCLASPITFTSTGSFRETRRTLEATLLPGGPGSPSESLDIRVSQSTDDAEEQEDGDMVRFSSDLEMVTEGGDPQMVGMRFQNVTIDQGTFIFSAYIEFEADETDSEPTTIVFYGQDSDTASNFSSSDFDISSRPSTTATVSWNNVPDWNTTSEKHQTPDISSIIQEIVNRPGSGKRVAESYNGESSNAPLLHIEY